jgi:hypothetical protein
VFIISQNSLPFYATAEMYALKILLGVLSGKKAPRGGGTFFPATPQVLY